MIKEERIRKLNSNSFQKNEFILYWMQASQRIEYNHAFEYAKILSNKYEKPLVIYFGLTDNYPEANLRHYSFMLEGLIELKKDFEKQNISFIIKHISPESGAVDLGKKACLVIVDSGYLKIQRYWRNFAAKKIKCPLIEVESDVIVPVREASVKEEYSAATLRPKIQNKIPIFLKQISKVKIENNFREFNVDSLDISNKNKLLSSMNIDKSVKPVKKIIGGTGQAKKKLKIFIKEKLDKYADEKNYPNKNYLSNLSSYLHFGQISPVFIGIEILKSDSPSKESFLEELIIRRELAINYVFYNPNYDSFDGLPEWAKISLKKHESDNRQYQYNLEDFENAETHDSYWNAAQKEMIKTGKMHGYMRMYWGKKILQWTKDVKQAFRIAIFINNKYEIDGRDPNSYAGVAWCFGKHDRPWKERPIFGKIRYMSKNGLDRKFSMKEYVDKNI